MYLVFEGKKDLYFSKINAIDQTEVMKRNLKFKIMQLNYFCFFKRILQRILTFLLQTYRAYLQELETSANPSQAVGIASPYASGSSPGFLLRLKHRAFILLTP